MNSTAINIKTDIKVKKEESPSKYLLASIRKSKNQRKKDDYYSFKNNEEALRFIKQFPT